MRKSDIASLYVNVYSGFHPHGEIVKSYRFKDSQEI